jgi:N-alpha-acetyltransferase 40
MQPSWREACIDLIEATSLGHYRGSETGWSRSKKLREMRHPALKYLLLLLPLPPPPPTPLERDAASKVVEGFLSFMITEEDGREVIYCYELHLQPRLRGKGVGKRMMELMEMIGARVGVEKAMLTVFRSNERAIRAYRKWVYEIDEFSPEPRTLRDDTVKEASYVILSKKRGDFAHEGSGQ